MDKFWEWMIKKEYGFIGSSGNYAIHGEQVGDLKGSGLPTFPTKHMLIGYMEEYLLLEHGLGVGNASNIYIELDKGKKYADIRYEQLKTEIIAKDTLKEKRVKE